MSLHSDVEALARALGVLWIDRDPLQVPSLAVKHRGGGLWRVFMGRERFDVDSPTAALILLGHARGLRVDIGECPACRERGSKHGLAMWERAEGWSRINAEGMRVWSWSPRDVRHEDSWRYSSSGPVENRRHTCRRPCPACTIDGKLTGRHTLAWERAILDAMPKPASVHAYTEDHGELGQEPREDWSPPEPGDPAARTALTVLADQAQARGDKLGDVLAWWLAGPDVLARHEWALSERELVVAVDLNRAAV